ncbi:hemocyte protein-glutamine gamma-glutamyltransferase-like [Mizuhopecten yessoensis]|uniref:hemocyte protein-glutamine gamma-glutamyltransferase-like n=1 Tax=Mizuhopecten yessoensis TaxID=6573 RepID=UPI000B459D53|nr:hemocyte protein-glutamine gamma-glutamyltransferase-like [Mizuhopecten yessoensis]
MHRRSGRRDVSPVRNRESRRYGPHKISYRILTELKYWRKYYLYNDQFDICDIPTYKPYKKFLDDESLWGEVNTDDEDNADEEEIKNEIHVTEINLNIVQNASNHHTSDYKCLKERTVDGKKEYATLVVRRGQLFSIDMTFNREYDAKKHDLKLQFKSGLDPSPLRGTEITIMVDENLNKFDNSGKWQARVANKMPNTKLEIEVLPPVKCVIGEWDLHVYTISKDKRGTSKQLHRKHDEDIIILFNPWCKEDEVYFPVDPDYEIDVDPREEYVLNPVGSVYRTGQRGLAWRFGQFDDDIVQICLMLVRRYFRGIVNQKMGDAGQVARAISSMVNSNNIDGVLVGKWGAPYDDGVKPWNWTGSTKILKQYHKEERPVKFGQCWVFSGVTVTVCRALGIPCRSVTNYNSAHDTDRTNEIEYLIASDGEKSALRGDSVW